MIIISTVVVVVGPITAHNIVLNCLIISSLTITGLIEYSQVWIIISPPCQSGRGEERRGEEVMLAASLTLNQFVTCQAARLDISVSIPQHIPAPADYTILARIDELLPAAC